MSSVFFQATRYIKHWLYEVDEHSLHAPFAFSFTRDVIRNDHDDPAFKELESIREALHKDRRSIEVTDLGAGSRKNKGNQKMLRDIAKYELSSPGFSRFLFRIIRHFQFEEIVEVGTSLGINTMYLSRAAPQGTIHTIEGCPNTALAAKEGFTRIKADNIRLMTGEAGKILSEVLQTIKKIDLAYIDANHTYEGTTGLFKMMLSRIHDGSVLVIDDIHWSAGMEKAWDEIRNHDKVTLSLDLFDSGILFFREGLPGENIRIHF